MQAVDSNTIDKICSDLLRYEITLEKDAASLGPTYINDIIATCRNYINAVSRILLNVMQEKHGLEALLSAESVLYDAEASELLISEKVRKLPSIDDRKAAVASLLRNRLQVINSYKLNIQNLEYLEKMVKLRHRELKDTMSEIRLQRSLLRDELDTKSFYGDERDPDVKRDDDLGIDELDALIKAHNLKNATEGPKLENPGCI
jgi:hypothetical protein